MATCILSYEKLLCFCRALNEHMSVSECFFDSNLLGLIDTVLGYSTSSFIVYELNSTYKSSEGHNLQLGEAYEKNYLDVDPLAKYITSNYDRLLANGQTIVKTSDVFKDYESSEYHRALAESSSVEYAAVLLFDGLRLTVYKTGEEGDFTDEELDLLDELSQILTSSYLLFSKIKKPSEYATLAQLKNMYLDAISTGLVILDSNFNILDSNTVAEQYISELAPNRPMSFYFSTLLPLLNFTPVSAEVSHVDRMAKFDNYVLDIRLYFDENAVSEERRNVYCVIINDNGAKEENEDSKTMHESRKKAFADEYSLSNRELEIVDCLYNGLKYQDIADTLFISINTVRTHIKNVYRKLDIDNQRTLLYLFNNYLNDAR